jgi:hypothetical protein
MVQWNSDNWIKKDRPPCGRRSWVKRCFGRLPAVVVVALVVALLLPGSAAIGAAEWLIGEALFSVESLFAFAEDEFDSAVFAIECFVWHNGMPPSNFSGIFYRRP